MTAFSGDGPAVGQTGEVSAYLDNAATTPMRPDAIEAMLPYFSDVFGNPSGMHAAARAARAAVEDARDLVASALGALPGEVVFTGGGTEADNLAVIGTVDALSTGPLSTGSRATGLVASNTRARGGGVGPIVCSAMEHHAVLRACRAAAARHGVDLREVPVGPDGIIDLDALAAACTPEVSLVSVMLVNNEVGTIQPFGSIAQMVRLKAPGAVLHTDAVQGVPWLDVAGSAREADLVAISGHKFGGPKGVGALVIRASTPISPLVHGGGQERERRSGTHNVAGIVAMATALAATIRERDGTVAAVGMRRDRLVDGLLASVAGASETGARSAKVAGNAHLCFDGVESEALLVLLDGAGIAASAGASCASGAIEPSHVLLAMGFPASQASSGIRFSLGPATTDAEIDHALEIVPASVARLRD